MTRENWQFATRAVHAGLEPDPSYGGVVPAIHQASTYVQRAPGDFVEEYDYSRSANPTRAALERALGELPERHRRLMESLFHEQEPSYDEISRLLGIPKGSIGPIRGRCLARLRISLAEDREMICS